MRYENAIVLSLRYPPGTQAPAPLLDLPYYYALLSTPPKNPFMGQHGRYPQRGILTRCNPNHQEGERFGRLGPQLSALYNAPDGPTDAAVVAGGQNSEAHNNGQPEEGLGTVGGTIVAETLIGLLETDATSFMGSNRNWMPTLGNYGQFKMADLLSFRGPQQG